MLHSISPTWLFSGWFAAVALAVTWSVTMDPGQPSLQKSRVASEFARRDARCS